MEKTRYRVLFVEDDKVDQTAFERLVQAEQLPYDYVIAGSLAQARSILDSEQFDVVISDYLLGDGTAFDVLSLVKNVPVIVVTGTGSEQVAVKAWRAGAYDYLVKDIERSYLKALPITVENALRHKDMEKKLHLLSGAIMSTDDSVHITDLQGKIIFVNKAFCETYGYKQQEVLGKDSSILWIKRNHNIHTRSVFQTQIAPGNWMVGFYHRRKDTSIFPVSLSRSIIKDASGNEIAVVSIARDITEHILIQDELRRENRKIQQQYQQQRNLAIMIAGALKRLLASKAIDNARRLNPDVRAHLDQARKIVADFLDIIQADADQTNSEPKELRINN